MACGDKDCNKGWMNIWIGLTSSLTWSEWLLVPLEGLMLLYNLLNINV